MTSSYCMHCGHAMAPGRFCAQCGTAVPKPVDPSAVDPSAVAPSGPDLVSATFTQRPTGNEHAPNTAPRHDDVAAAGRVVPHPPAARAGRRPARRSMPRAGRWLPWLALWLLAALVVGMSGVLLGREVIRPDTSERIPPVREGQSPGAPGPQDLTSSSTAQVPVTAPVNQDVSGEPVDYAAAHLLDQQPETAWRMPGDGTGVRLVFTLPSRTDLTSVGLINGYAKTDGDTDWYPRNRRIERVRWEFDDGTTLSQPLTSTTALQTIGTDVSTSTVTLHLEQVSAPGTDSGRDYTAISDVRFVGGPADN